MFITYYKNITYSPEHQPNAVALRHSILHTRIRIFITRHKVEQEEYIVTSNNNYTFIYLSNGDRIDIKH